MKKQVYIIRGLLPLLLASCGKDDKEEYTGVPDPFEHIKAAFGNNIDPDNLYNYASQPVPDYIQKDNSAGNAITDKGATLGRVLFYDVNLSVDNTIACASCHKQEHAFGDDAVASTGVNGTTGRHAMRLVNIRFGAEESMFWDERADNLEQQTTMPVRDHGEMGFSGENGDMAFEDLLEKLGKIGYYKELFTWVYGSEEVTEQKIQLALAQFIRSIQSFDSKFDEGRAAAGDDGPPFANFTPQENQGKNLFLMPPVFDRDGGRIGGGAGCAGCHQLPEFDIDPVSGNNGLRVTISGEGVDLNNTRAPSMHDVVKADGTLNGPLMHTGGFTTLNAVMAHYNNINAAGNNRLDPRLRPGGTGQQLNLTPQEIAALSAFLRTLSGENIYVDRKWSNPFL